MKVRCRWFTAPVDRNSLRTIGESMLAREYSRRRAAGFRMETTRRDYLEGSFLERIEWDDELDDAAGGHINVHRVELRRLRFRLSTDRPELEVLDPPRSARPFLTALKECAGGGLVVEEPRVRPSAWLSALEPTVIRPSVVSLTTDALVLSAGVAAFVRVEGSGEVRHELRRFLPKHEVDANRLQVAWRSSAGANRCELFSTGRAVVEEGPPEEIVPLLREALRVAVTT
jgi:hypothetical protein